MGVLTFLLTDSSSGPFSPGLALFLLGLPFLDTLGVAGQRLAEDVLRLSATVRIFIINSSLWVTHYEAVTASM